ncbi:Syntaxin-6 [Madurella mycetomatis]|uniref:t-SNARE affecting a late Golgi compartment protein 1 n=1 Tax=Madurella mycetomatis TaxID=100816 RepID=A0A175W0J3_9PEZI|nr:Syntaxin-6 [Madurella mycetomatis]
MMSSTNEEDPFLQVQQDVLAQLQSTRSLFTSYLRIRSLSTAATSPELASARADLESSLTSLAEDLADLVESVKAVESNPSQYGLDASEVIRRKRLVQEVGGEVEDMREELSKASPGSGGGGSARRGAKGNNTDLPDPSAFAIADGETDAGDDYAAEFEREQQVMMMREQDEHLDGVFQTVGNLRRQADDMGRELEEQREMLEVVDQLADRVGGRLQTGMEKLRYVMRRNEDRLSSCCIGVLIVVLIILLILLLVL